MHWMSGELRLAEGRLRTGGDPSLRRRAHVGAARRLHRRPHDSAVGRLAWWIARVARGGEVLVPGSPDDPMSLIDARDLAAFALLARAGTFEATGPSDRHTRDDLMQVARAVTSSGVRFTYVGDEWFATQDVEEWTEVPLWAPGTRGDQVFPAGGRSGGPFPRWCSV